MAKPNIANAYVTSLNGAINNSTTTVIVVDAPPAELIAPFKIRVSAEGANTNEIMTVTSFSTVTLTVVRASEPWNGVQSASSHASGAIVEHNLTAGTLIDSSFLLESHTASAQATLDFTSWYSSNYDEYKITIINLKPATDNVYLYMRCSTNGGSSYDSGTNYDSAQGYVYTGGAGAAGATGNNISAMRLFDTIGSGGSYSYSGSLYLLDPGSTTEYKVVLGQSHFYHATLGALVAGYGSHVYKSTTAVNAIQFLFSSGNITSGKIRISGIPKI